MENCIVLSLGTNIGDKLQNLSDAIELMEKAGLEIISSSSIYQTKAWGFDSKYDFLNQIIKTTTEQKPEDLLILLKSIEHELGRNLKNSANYEDRIIDIDILFFNDTIIQTKELQIPHSKLHLRNFILDPLIELDSNLIHPLLKKTVKELRIESMDKHNSILFLP